MQDGRILKFNLLPAERALLLVLRHIVRLKQVLDAVKVEDVVLAAAELNYLAGRPKMLQTYRTLLRFNEQYGAEGELSNRSQQRLVAPVHQGHGTKVLPVGQDPNREHVNQDESYQDEDEHGYECSEKEEKNE